MKMKLIGFILITVTSSLSIISCGKTLSPNGSNQPKTAIEQSSPKDSASEDSSIVGEQNKPTIQVKSIGTIDDFKNKSKSDIEKLLGKPVSEDNSKSVYAIDDYTFEITYLNGKCNEIKITPKIDMRYPAEGPNILNLVGISNAGEPDKISPSELEWDNKFNTFKINIVPTNETTQKIAYVIILLNS